MGRIVIGGASLPVTMIDWRHDIRGDQQREYSGYTGSYTYDGKQFVTTVDAARIRAGSARSRREECGSRMGS